MTIIVMDGFESEQVTNAIAYGTTTDAWTRDNTVRYNDEGTSLYCPTSIGTVDPVFAMPTVNTGDVVHVAFAWRYSQTQTYSYDLASLSDREVTPFSSSYSDAWLRMLDDGELEVRRGSTGLQTGIGVYLDPETWYHIEFIMEYASSAGSWAVRVNGNEVASGTDGNTFPEPFLYVGLGNAADHSDRSYVWYDDLVAALNPAAPLGITRVRRLLPTSQNTGEWAGSDGNSVDNHLLVDDGDKDSADYIESVAGDDEVDLYGHGTTIAAGSTVHAVQAFAAANLTETGTDDFAVVLKSGTTEATTARTLGDGSPQWKAGDIANTDPDTAAAWTVSAANAALLGVRS